MSSSPGWGGRAGTSGVSGVQPKAARIKQDEVRAANLRSSEVEGGIGHIFRGFTGAERNRWDGNRWSPWRSSSVFGDALDGLPGTRCGLLGDAIRQSTVFPAGRP